MGQGPGLHAGKWGLLQPVADGLKLFIKEDIIPASADRPLFILAPFLIFIGALTSFIAVPFSENIIITDMNIGIFYIVGMGSLAVIALILAGWSSNNKWALYGGMRSAAQIISYEIPAGISLVTVIMLAGSLSMRKLYLTRVAAYLTGLFLTIHLCQLSLLSSSLVPSLRPTEHLLISLNLNLNS